MKMAATKQSQAVSLANDLLTFAQQVTALRDFANNINNRYNKQGTSTVLNALPTAPLNTDGSLGTADGTPNVAHPIDTRVVTSLARAVSSNDLITAVSNLQAFQAYMTNAAVATADRSAVFDPLVGG